MIRRLAALILLNTLSLLQTAEGPPQVSCALLELGDNLTLSCPVLQKESGLLYWYKLKFGYMLETVAAGTLDQIKLLEQMDKSRFSVTKRNARPVLDIRNVSKEDEGTYFCQAGTAYQMKFINGTLLAVNDFKNQERSFYVKQSPLTESVQPGDSVTLQCSLVSRNKEDRVQCPEQELWTSLIVLGSLLACCVIGIAALIISRNQKPVCKHCRGEASNHAQHARSAEDQPSNGDGDEGTVNYVALDFPSRSAKRWKNTSDLPQECLYSGTRDAQESHEE
ncbi:uncharacterized protein LOC117737204 [Cyclopterus lumpus]|uniref:uncharacterized protein LOC117737204 n=1 Tax=Cyclopterus lumpus TaxID=8103 RepID=UPI001486ADCE|nr:uncharacterized protein LOC117737204 [Cyclopterus lumpus]